MSNDHLSPVPPVASAAIQEQPTAMPANAGRSALGLIALLLAVLGFVLVLIPLIGVVGFILLFAAFVLSIVALARRGRRKALAGVALVLSVVGPIVGGIVLAATAVKVVGDALQGAGASGTASSARRPRASSCSSTSPSRTPRTRPSGSRTAARRCSTRRAGSSPPTPPQASTSTAMTPSAARSTRELARACPRLRHPARRDGHDAHVSGCLRLRRNAGTLGAAVADASDTARRLRLMPSRRVTGGDPLVGCAMPA